MESGEKRPTAILWEIGMQSKRKAENKTERKMKGLDEDKDATWLQIRPLLVHQHQPLPRPSKCILMRVFFFIERIVYRTKKKIRSSLNI